MPSGLQVWDAGGTLIFDSTVQSGRIVGSVNASSATGSVSADLSTGIPFAFPVVTGTGEYSIFEIPNQLRVPQITVTANSVSWVRAPDATDAPPATVIIYYGVY